MAAFAYDLKKYIGRKEKLHEYKMAPQRNYGQCGLRA